MANNYCESSSMIPVPDGKRDLAEEQKGEETVWVDAASEAERIATEMGER